MSPCHSSSKVSRMSGASAQLDIVQGRSILQIM